MIVLDHVWKSFPFKYMIILEAAASNAVELYLCILAGQLFCPPSKEKQKQLFMLREIL